MSEQFNNVYQHIEHALSNGVSGKELVDHIKRDMAFQVSSKLERCIDEEGLYDQIKDEIYGNVKECLSTFSELIIWFDTEDNYGMVIRYMSSWLDDDGNLIGELNVKLFQDCDEEEIVDGYDINYAEDQTEAAIYEFMKKYIEHGKTIYQFE